MSVLYQRGRDRGGEGRDQRSSPSEVSRCSANGFSVYMSSVLRVRSGGWSEEGGTERFCTFHRCVVATPKGTRYPLTRTSLYVCVCALSVDARPLWETTRRTDRRAERARTGMRLWIPNPGIWGLVHLLHRRELEYLRRERHGDLGRVVIRGTLNPFLGRGWRCDTGKTTKITSSPVSMVSTESESKE